MWVAALGWLLLRSQAERLSSITLCVEVLHYLYALYTRYYTVCQEGEGHVSEVEERESEYIWIQDAQKEFGHSLVWFYRQIKNGVLTKYTRAGDLRIYLSRKELKDLFQFRPTSKPKEQGID